MKTILRQKREEIPLKQSEMANVLNLALRTYQRIENGERKPGYEAVIALQSYFNCTIDYLLQQEVNTNKE